MAGEINNGMRCAEFEALLNQAVDETLAGEELEGFQAHARVCAVCGPLAAEVDAGRRWLKSLAEIDPPANLVRNILVATTGMESFRLHRAATAQPASGWERVREWIGAAVSPVFAVARQPRFAMSFGMAFFSLSIAMSLTGVKASDLRHADLRPSALRRTYYETSGRIVKYYENIRFVYQIESRVREFKRVTTPAAPAPEGQSDQPDKERKNNNTSGEPEQRQERNYSQGENQPVLAAAPDSPPVPTVTTYRRIV